MEDILFKAQAIGFASLLNVLLAFGAYRLACRGRGLSDLDRLTVMLAIVVVAVPAVTVGLGAFGILGRWTVLAAVAVFAAAAWGLTRRDEKRARFAGPLLTEMLAALRQDRLLVVAILPAVVALAMLLGWAAPRPSYGFDPLNYHLPLAAAIVRTGGLAPIHFPPYAETFPYFTMTGDMFGVWAMLSTGDTSLLPLANLAPFALLAVVLYGFLRDSLPSRAAAAAVTSALLTVPSIFVLLTDAYVEIPLWAFMFGALRMIVLSARKDHDFHLFVMASLLCGSMIGTKLTGLPMAVVVLAAWLVVSRGQGAARRAGRLALFAGGVALTGSYFYVRNMVLTGSPVYPFPMTIFGVQVFGGDADHAARVAGTTISRFLAPLVMSGELFRAVFGTRTPPNSSMGLGATGPFFVVAALLAILPIVRSPSTRASGGAGRGPGAAAGTATGVGAWLGPVFLGASLLAIAVYIYLPWCAPYLYGNVRFVYPAVPFAAFALFSVPAVAGVKRWAIVAACLILQAVSFIAAVVPVSAGGVALAGLAVASGMGGAALSGHRLFRRVAPVIPVAVIPAVIIAAVVFRTETISAYRNPGSPAGPASWVSERADCAGALANLSPEGPFAITMARGAPHAWFIFPLIGERLQREPVYVDVAPDPTGRCLKCPDAWPGWSGADVDYWMKGILRSGARALVILNDDQDVEVGRSPVELEWVADRPDVFVPFHKGRFCSVYRLAIPSPGVDQQ